MGVPCSNPQSQASFKESELPAFMENNKKLIDEYRVGSCIAYINKLYTVHTCTHLKTGRIFALRKHRLNIDNSKLLLKELELYRDLNHPSAIKIMEYFKSENSLFIVSEFFEGKNLPAYILGATKFDELDIIHIVKQLLGLAAYLHKKRIINRNLTITNVMYDGQLVKVTNFHKATRFKPGQMLSEIVSETPYQAPEMLKKKYNSKVDIWAIGVITFALLTGDLPFYNPEGKDTENQILTKEITKNSFKDFNLSENAFDFVRLSLAKNQNKRPSAEQLLDHPWIKGGDVNNSNLKLNLKMVQNLNSYNFNDSFQRAIFLFIVSWAAKDEDKALALKEFQKLNTSNTGLLTKEELIAGLQALPDPISETEANGMFEMLDWKKTGFVEYHDFLEMYADKRILLQEDNLLHYFDILDSNKNGSIMLHDLKKVFGDHVERKSIEKKFNKYAKGNSIDRSKFIAMLKSLKANRRLSSIFSRGKLKTSELFS